MENLSLELRKLGLRKKEVDIYLAGLELGPSSAQKIAKKASISRPTTYSIINTLEEKGLFREIKKDKKTYYLAESPDKLLGLLRTQKRELEEKEREFIRIITVLKSKYFLKDENKIKTYKGKKELKALKEELKFTNSKEIFLLSSKVNKEIERTYKEIKKRLGEIKVKEIYPKEVRSKEKWLQRKTFSFNFKGTLILTDKVILLKKKKGLLIENETVVDLIKFLFLGLWNSI